MDKYEYNLKLDQIKSLSSEENYVGAAEIADTINWNKIKNINTLVKAGEIYEKAERYDDARDILLMAYVRSPIGRMIIYRLAEVAIKMGDYDAATEYYDEFVEIAPHDDLRYVLKYSIKKGQGASYDELIEILEEFKEQEYTEEWAYELAYLYHKAGKTEKCIEACDELILWFGDGPYVERALELKMLYQPLTKDQEEKYRKFRFEHEGKTQIDAAEMTKAGELAHDTVTIPQVEVNQEKFNTVNLQKEIAKGMQQIIDAKEKGEVADTMDNIKKIVDEIPYLKLPKEEEENSSLQDTQHIATDEEIDGSLKHNFQEMLGEDSDGQIRLRHPLPHPLHPARLRPDADRGAGPCGGQYGQHLLPRGGAVHTHPHFGRLASCHQSQGDGLVSRHAVQHGGHRRGDRRPAGHAGQDRRFL